MSARMNGESFRAALRARGQALPAELAVFIALELTERMMQGSSRGLVLGDVLLASDGGAGFDESAELHDEASAARSIHAVLLTLLVAGRPGLAPSLLRLVEQGPAGGVWSLCQLRDELEAALVPLNREALSRVLARLVRDLQRAGAQASGALDRVSCVPRVEVDPQALDGELDGWLSGASVGMPIASAARHEVSGLALGKGILGSAAPGTVAPIRTRARAGGRRGPEGPRVRGPFDVDVASAGGHGGLRGMPEMERGGRSGASRHRSLRWLLAAAAVGLAGWMWVSATGAPGIASGPARWEPSSQQ